MQSLQQFQLEVARNYVSITQLKEIEAKYPGLEHIMLQWPEGMPLREFKEQLRLVAREVMPAFTGAAAAIGAGKIA